MADTALIELCNKTQWTDGLWLSCHSDCGPNKTSICGGVNNARNRLQTCMRLAIDLGAGVMFPYVTQRAEDSWVVVDRTLACPDVWWDIEALRTSMSELCPSLRIVSCEESPNMTVLALTPRHYKERPHYNTTFRASVDNDLSANDLILTNVTSDEPLLLRYVDAHIAWSYRDSNELTTLRKALFRVLPFNRTLLSIGAELTNSKGLDDGNFVGIHLRAEYDWPAMWGTPTQQMEIHAAEIRRVNAKAVEPITNIYVSCGDQATIQTFRDMMAPENYTVHDKWTLCADRPEILDIIDHLSFDEKGVIEYSVLVRGRYFQGNLISTMSSLVAYARTMDQPDFFKTHMYPNTTRWGLNRFYMEPLIMKGDEFTKLFVVDGQDIMDAFP